MQATYIPQHATHIIVLQTIWHKPEESLLSNYSHVAIFHNGSLGTVVYSTYCGRGAGCEGNQKLSKEFTNYIISKLSRL